jgi:Holliday junction resolvase RusA-like endonuclease
MTFQWTVMGDPFSAQRPRVTKRGTYTPKSTRDAMAAVAYAFRAAYPEWLVADGDWEWHLVLTFHRYARYRRDLDNLTKTVMDGLTGTLYRDDFQVTSGSQNTLWVPSRALAKTTVVAYPTLVGYWVKPPKEGPRT